MKLWIVVLSIGVAAGGCASARGASDPAALSANEEWVRRACTSETFEPSEWPKVQKWGMQISVPPDIEDFRHKRGSETVISTIPDHLYVQPSRRGSLMIRRHREARYEFDRINNRVRLGQVNCAITYGGLPAEVVAWNEKGEFGTAIRVAPQWEGEDSDKWLFAMVTSKVLAEATMLRHVLRTIMAVPDTGRQP